MAARSINQLIWLDVTVKDVLARYEMGETVGVGGFAVVKKGRDRETGDIVAIKVVDKWRYETEENSEREIRILSKVSHENCIKMHAVYVTARRVYIVTELVTGGELLDKVNERGMFSEPEAAFVARQVLEGVNYLHQKGIVHRDLKLENILLQDNEPRTKIKIADFGLSKVFSASTTLSTVCGSPLYMAPELLTVEQQGDYSPAVDVWSIGVILFILLAGYSPFEDANDAVLFEKIKSGRYDDGDPIWDSISKGAKDLISRMLDVRVDQRPSAANCLAHPWLNEQADIMGKAAPGSLPAAAGRPQNAKQLTSLSRMLSVRSTQRTELANAVRTTSGEAPDAAQGGGATHSGVTRQGSNRLAAAPVSAVMNSDAQSRDRSGARGAAACTSHLGEARAVRSGAGADAAAPSVDSLSSGLQKQGAGGGTLMSGGLDVGGVDGTRADYENALSLPTGSAQGRQAGGQPDAPADDAAAGSASASEGSRDLASFL